MADGFNFDEHFLNNYNTSLSKVEEKKFQNWLVAESGRRKRDMTEDLSDYDLRGYWKGGGYADTSGQGHMPDTYKKPNHPTFSDQSIYHGALSPWGVNYQGGTWAEDGSSYTPSPVMLQYTHPRKYLEDYMQQVEPGVTLVMPLAQSPSIKEDPLPQ